MDPLILAELLCARLCHDLAGPVGAAAAGAELFEDMADAETLGMVAASAAGAAARLKFFRAALSPAAAAPQSAASLRDLMEGYLGTLVSAASPGLQLRWPDPPAMVDGATAHLLLNMALLAKDALPRGGTIQVDTAGALPRMVIHGEPAALTDEARAVLHDGRPPSGPRGAHVYFTRILAERLGGKLTAKATSDGLALAIDGATPPPEVG